MIILEYLLGFQIQTTTLGSVNTGYEIQIDDLAIPDGNPIHKTGAIYNFAIPLNAQASKPVGQWNTFDIEAIDRHIALY